MFTSLFHRLRIISRELWVRVLLIATLSVLSVLMARVIGPLIPTGFADMIGASAVDRLLDILATSMLAVTTFSLSVMVSIHRAISSQWTPRAHRIQQRDRSTQMVLATFVGAFIYALASIVLRATPYFNENDIVVLFAMTLLVLVLVVVMILRWILRLQTMGSLVDIADNVAALTQESVLAQMARPCHGAEELSNDIVIPSGSTGIYAEKSGYVQRIFPAAIDEKAKGCGGLVYVLHTVGDHLNKGDTIAQISDPTLEKAVRRNVQIGAMRDIDQDPELGMLIMAEIASKALSPGVNDSSTATDMLDRMTGVIQSWDGPRHAPVQPAIYRRVYIPALDPARLMVDSFGLVARDGAAVFEVQRCLQSRLASLARHGDKKIAHAARLIATEAMIRAQDCIGHQIDSDALRDHVDSLAQTNQPTS